MITNKKINEILSQAKINNEDAIGIRIVDDYYDDYDLKIGDKLGVSYVWFDGDYTDEKLNGVSAISFDAKLEDVTFKGYIGKKILVINGSIEGYGEDEGEIIVADAEIIDIIEIKEEIK